MPNLKTLSIALFGVAMLSSLNLPNTMESGARAFGGHTLPITAQESIFLSTAHADVVAPQAPPELSDTLTDFRTKEQLTEQVYIEGKVDPQNSIEVPTVPGDLEARVMRLSAAYQAQYEVAVPRHGVSILRFYDLNGFPLEVVSTRVENQGFLAEVSASPSELVIRQFQGASTTLLQVRLKGINRNFVFTLKPLVLVNQQRSVRTLITAMTVNYYIEGTNYVAPVPYQFGKPNPQAQAINFDQVNQEKLESDLVEAAAVVMPLNDAEKKKAAEVMAKIKASTGSGK